MHDAIDTEVPSRRRRRQLAGLAAAVAVIVVGVAITAATGGGESEDREVNTATRVTAPPRDWGGHRGVEHTYPDGSASLVWDEEFGVQVTVNGSAGLAELRKVAESLELVDAGDPRLAGLER